MIMPFESATHQRRGQIICYSVFRWWCAHRNGERQQRPGCSGRCKGAQTNVSLGADPPAAAGIVVAVPNDEADARSHVQEIASRAKDELAKTLGVAPPALVRIESHRTAEDFERISGRPWFAFGAVVEGNIQLMPVRQLVERGTLETTIRRQMVHLLTDSTLARRPAWVRSGAAIYFGDNRPDSATLSNLSRERCPSDAELLSPLSPGALGTAYAQAYGCFARQIGKRAVVAGRPVNQGIRRCSTSS